MTKSLLIYISAAFIGITSVCMASDGYNPLVSDVGNPQVSLNNSNHEPPQYSPYASTNAMRPALNHGPPATTITVNLGLPLTLPSEYQLTKLVEELELWHPVSGHPSETFGRLRDYFVLCKQIGIPRNHNLEQRFRTAAQSHLHDTFVRDVYQSRLDPERLSQEQLVIFRWKAESYKLPVPTPTTSQELWYLYQKYKNSRYVRIANTTLKVFTVLAIGSISVKTVFDIRSLGAALALPSTCLVNVLIDDTITNYQDGISSLGPYLVLPVSSLKAPAVVLGGAVAALASYALIPLRDWYSRTKLQLPIPKSTNNLPAELHGLNTWLNFLDRLKYEPSRATIHEYAFAVKNYLKGQARARQQNRLTDLDPAVIDLVYKLLKLMEHNFEIDQSDNGLAVHRNDFIKTRHEIFSLVPDTRPHRVARLADVTLPVEFQQLSDFLDSTFTTENYVPSMHSVVSMAKKIRSYLKGLRPEEMTDESDLEMDSAPLLQMQHEKIPILVQQLVNLLRFYEFSPTFRAVKGMALKSDLIRLTPGVAEESAPSRLLKIRVALYADYPLYYLLNGGIAVAIYSFVNGPLFSQLQEFRYGGFYTEVFDAATYNKEYAYEQGHPESRPAHCCLTDRDPNSATGLRTNMVCPPLGKEYEEANFALFDSKPYTQRPNETLIYTLPWAILILNLFYLLMG